MRRASVFSLLVIALVITGCGESTYHNKFERGDFVKSRLDGRVGQVERVWGSRTKNPTYDVRFVAGATATDTHLLGNDGDIVQKPYCLIRFMREFELEGPVPPPIIE